MIVQCVSQCGVTRDLCPRVVSCKRACKPTCKVTCKLIPMRKMLQPGILQVHRKQRFFHYKQGPLAGSDGPPLRRGFARFLTVPMPKRWGLVKLAPLSRGSLNCRQSVHEPLFGVHSLRRTREGGVYEIPRPGFGTGTMGALPDSDQMHLLYFRRNIRN